MQGDTTRRCQSILEPNVRRLEPDERRLEPDERRRHRLDKQDEMCRYSRRLLSSQMPSSEAVKSQESESQFQSNFEQSRILSLFSHSAFPPIISLSLSSDPPNLRFTYLVHNFLSQLSSSWLYITTLFHNFFITALSSALSSLHFST